MGFNQPSLFRPEHSWEGINGNHHTAEWCWVSVGIPSLRRRKEKIVRLYPILFVVTQALQHAEWTNQLQVRETNFFENFALCRCFERFA